MTEEELKAIWERCSRLRRGALTMGTAVDMAKAYPQDVTDLVFALREAWAKIKQLESHLTDEEMECIEMADRML